jgi:hypothetical protein
MSDFVQKANVKRSVRTLTTRIADVATLNTLVQGVIDTNAFQCVDHVVAGETHPVQSVEHSHSASVWSMKTRQP